MERTGIGKNRNRKEPGLETLKTGTPVSYIGAVLPGPVIPNATGRGGICFRLTFGGCTAILAGMAMRLRSLEKNRL